MKKTLFLALFSALALLSLSSCTKYDAAYTQPPTPPPAGTTAYTFSMYTSGYKVYLSEHNIIGDRIHNTIIFNAEKNVAYSYAANNRAKKIKVQLIRDNSQDWVQQVYYLEEGENIDIEITPITLVGPNEP